MRKPSARRSRTSSRAKCQTRLPCPPSRRRNLQEDGPATAGGAAVEAILGARKDKDGTLKPYAGLFDLCARVDLKKVNKKTLEALVDAGAFTLGLPNGVVTGALGSQDSVLGPVTSNAQDVVAYDPLRNQMIVGQPLANRVVIHRSGLPTSCGIVPSTPNPSDLGASVTFGTSVSASGGATPEAGRMTVVASNGQQCVDSIGASSFPGIRTFSCNIAFSHEGNIAIYAEYTGSTNFAFCRTPTISQTVISRIFANGFE